MITLLRTVMLTMLLTSYCGYAGGCVGIESFQGQTLLREKGTLRFIGRQRDGNGKKTLYHMCL